MTKQIKIVVERRADCFLAYPLGLRGTIVGQGATYDEALADGNATIRFHIDTFGAEALPDDFPLVEAFVAGATIPV